MDQHKNPEEATESGKDHLTRMLHRFPVWSVCPDDESLKPQSETNRRVLGDFFEAGRHRGHVLPFLTGAGGSTIGELAVEVVQAELEEVFEREGAGEPDSYPPSV